MRKRATGFFKVRPVWYAAIGVLRRQGYGWVLGIEGSITLRNRIHQPENILVVPLSLLLGALRDRNAVGHARTSQAHPRHDAAESLPSGHSGLQASGMAYGACCLSGGKVRAAGCMSYAACCILYVARMPQVACNIARCHSVATTRLVDEERREPVDPFHQLARVVHDRPQPLRLARHLPRPGALRDARMQQTTARQSVVYSLAGHVAACTWHTTDTAQQPSPIARRSAKRTRAASTIRSPSRPSAR